MHRYQINLNDQPLRQNKAFLRAVYQNQELDNVRKWFEKLDHSAMESKTDRGMTLDSYLRLMTPSFYVILQTGSPYEEDIRCCAVGMDWQGNDRSLVVLSPFTENNYEVVAGIFERIYKHELGSIGVLCKD